MTVWYAGCKVSKHGATFWNFDEISVPKVTNIAPNNATLSAAGRHTV